MAVTLHAHTMSAVLSGNRGAVGVGIADITFNDDYTMTITLTDGSTYTSGNLRGAQGIPGIDAEFDGEELVITTGDHTETDGGEVSTIRVKGEARTIRDRVTEEMACSAYPTETVTGDIVSITDGAEDIPVKALSVAVEPVQAGSGDPSPDNVRAITGWDAVNVVRCGKNVFDISTIISGALQISGAIATNNNWRISDYIPVKGNLPITLSWDRTSRAYYQAVVGAYRSDKTFISAKAYSASDSFSHAFDMPYDAEYARVSYSVVVNNTDAPRNNIRVNLGSADLGYSEYVPYTAYPISLPSTVYGGTLDVASGVMTVDRAYFTSTWGNATKTTLTDYIRGAFRSGIKGNYPSYTKTPICNLAKYKAQFSEDSLHFYVNSVTSGDNVLVFLPVGTSDDTVIQVAYELAEPYTITLDPVTISTLLGNNTLYADAGQVTVRYRADVGLYIDKRIAEVQALVLES